MAYLIRHGGTGPDLAGRDGRHPGSGTSGWRPGPNVPGDVPVQATGYTPPAVPGPGGLLASDSPSALAPPAPAHLLIGEEDANGVLRVALFAGGPREQLPVPGAPDVGMLFAVLPGASPREHPVRRPPGASGTFAVLPGAPDHRRMAVRGRGREMLNPGGRSGRGPVRVRRQPGRRRGAPVRSRHRRTRSMPQCGVMPRCPWQRSPVR